MNEKYLSIFHSYGGNLDCLEGLAVSDNCTRNSPAGALWEIYQVSEMLVYTGDVCAEDPHICSTQFAMNCITHLSETVTLHDYTSNDNGEVCR